MPFESLEPAQPCRHEAAPVFRFPVALPEGSHPIPSRTRKLSPPGPMVLQSDLCGRVGRRRNLFEPRSSNRAGFFFLGLLFASAGVALNLAVAVATGDSARKLTATTRPRPSTSSVSRASARDTCGSRISCHPTNPGAASASSWAIRVEHHQLHELGLSEPAPHEQPRHAVQRDGELVGAALDAQGRQPSLRWHGAAPLLQRRDKAATWNIPEQPRLRGQPGALSVDASTSLTVLGNGAATKVLLSGRWRRVLQQRRAVDVLESQLHQDVAALRPAVHHVSGNPADCP